jgi:anti-anti-sigma regulatory factor
MTLSEEKINGVLTIEISGKIHAEASEELLKKLNTLINQGERHLLLDFLAWTTSTAPACGRS